MKPHPHDAPRSALRTFGLGLPGTETKSPWPEHLDLVVAGKTFVFMNVDGISLRLSCKLPSSGSMALALPFCSPTPYGLGRSGWVTAVFADQEKPSVPLLKEWILESYRAQAPKRLLKSFPVTSDREPMAAAKPRGVAAREKKVSPPRARRATAVPAEPSKRVPSAASPQSTARTVQATSKKKGSKKISSSR